VNYYQQWFHTRTAAESLESAVVLVSTDAENRCWCQTYRLYKNLHYIGITLSNIHVIQESSFWTNKRIDSDYVIIYINPTFIISQNLKHCQTYMSNETLTILSMYNTSPGPHCQTYNSFWFFINRGIWSTPILLCCISLFQRWRRWILLTYGKFSNMVPSRQWNDFLIYKS
jgi:hypothetical protein